MWIDNSINQPQKEGNYKTLIEIDEMGTLSESDNEHFNGKDWSHTESSRQFIRYWWCEKEEYKVLLDKYEEGLNKYLEESKPKEIKCGCIWTPVEIHTTPGPWEAQCIKCKKIGGEDPLEHYTPIPPTLSRAQAQVALVKGNKITHSLFEKGDYIWLDSDKRLANSNYTILDKQQFWINKGGIEFDHGWYVIEDNVKVTDRDVVEFLKQLHGCSIVDIYGEYVLTGNSEEEIIDKKRKVDNGSTLGFYLKKHLISIIGK